MKIIYHNRNKLSEEEEEDATYVSFNKLLSDSDVLSLNLSLNQSTRHIISEAQFQQMKDGVVIVNTARGALIDEKALVSALDSGKVNHNSQCQKTSSDNFIFPDAHFDLFFFVRFSPPGWTFMKTSHKLNPAY